MKWSETPSLNSLRAFGEVAATGSFSDAAAALNVTQAAVSQQVRQLEARKLGEKIRRAITQKVGSLLVVGDDDVEATTVGLRVRGTEERRGVPLDDAVSEMVALAQAPR